MLAASAANAACPPCEGYKAGDVLVADAWRPEFCWGVTATGPAARDIVELELTTADSSLGSTFVSIAPDVCRYDVELAAGERARIRLQLCNAHECTAPGPYSDTVRRTAGQFDANVNGRIDGFDFLVFRGQWMQGEYTSAAFFDFRTVFMAAPLKTFSGRLVFADD